MACISTAGFHPESEKKKKKRKKKQRKNKEERKIKEIRKSFFSRQLTTRAIKKQRLYVAAGNVRTEQMPTAMHPSTLKTTHMVQL